MVSAFLVSFKLMNISAVGGGTYDHNYDHCHLFRRPIVKELRKKKNWKRQKITIDAFLKKICGNYFCIQLGEWCR